MWTGGDGRPRHASGRGRSARHPRRRGGGRPGERARGGRPGTVGLVTLLAVGAVLVTSAAAVGAARTSGPEEFDGGLIVSGASGSRNVVGSIVAARGVFTGVGRIVERPNRPGESDQISR